MSISKPTISFFRVVQAKNAEKRWDKCTIDPRTTPLPWIKGLKDHFKQAVLDGKKSIVDPQYPGSHIPFWWLGFWTELHNIHTIQRDWKKAIEWVDEHTGGLGLEQEVHLRKQAKVILSNLQWNEHTDIPWSRWSQHINIQFCFIPVR